MRFPLVALGSFALALGAMACGDDSGSAVTVEVTLTDAGCEPAELHLAPGSTRFRVTNDGADSITEFEILDGNKVLAEKENLTPGLTGTFTVNLSAGTYTLACPGGTEHPTGTLTVGQ